MLPRTASSQLAKAKKKRMTAGDRRNSRSPRWVLITAIGMIAVATSPGAKSNRASAAVSSNPVLSSSPCVDGQSVALDQRAGWRCDLMMTADQAYLVRVGQRDADLSITIVAPGDVQLLTVDAPTRRASPELALLGPQLTGKYGVVIRLVESGAHPVRVEIGLDGLQAYRDAALVSGLSKMSRSATFAPKPSREDAERNIALLRAALSNLAAAGARELEAEAQIRVAANFYWIVNDWTAAASAAQGAMLAFDRLGQPTMSAQAAMIRGASLAELAGITRSRGARAADTSAHTQFDEAERLLEGAADRFRAAAMKYDEAHALNNLGLVLFYQGRYEEARLRYLAAARIFGGIGERTSEALPLQNIAAIDYERGDYAEATRSFEQLLPKLDAEHDRSEYVAILNNLGTMHYVLGNADQALKVLSEALQLTEDGANVSGRARTLHALGRTYLILGDQDRAAVYLEQALELRRSAASQDRRGLLISLVRNGDLYRDQGEVKRALELHLQALDHVVSPEERTRVLLALGLDHMAAGSTDAAIDTYERALKLELPDDWPVRTSVTGAYGYALALTGNPTGRGHLERAAKLHQAAGDDELAAQDYYLLATLDRRARNGALALVNVGKALALYESQRLRAVNPDLRATYVSRRADTYELQTELYMSLAENAHGPERSRLQSASFMSAESLRQRTLDDFRQFAQSAGVSPGDSTAGKLVELDNRLATKRHRLAVLMEQTNPSAERVAALRLETEALRTEADVLQTKLPRARTHDAAAPGTFSIGELQRTIANDTVLLTWLLGQERSWLWCISREAATALPLSPRQDIDKAVRELYALWSAPTNSDASRKRELDASRVILGPATKLLRAKRNVSVVADGLLRAIPLGALWLATDDESSFTRLAQTHAISYRPTLRQWSAARPSVAQVETNRRLLLVGDPLIFGSADRAFATSGILGADAPAVSAAEFPRLPGSRREIDSIVRIARGWQIEVLVGEKATKTAILAEPLETFRVLHFATHARLDVRDPQLSAIVLSTTRAQAGTSQAALSLREIVGLQLHADTVVLSACEGSLGKQYRGQLSFGLSEAFLLAGAEHVLGSLWRVSDAATEHYMQQFYEQYFRGLSPGAAAQTAMRNMMRDPAYAHPFFWAAFVVLSA